MGDRAAPPEVGKLIKVQPAGPPSKNKAAGRLEEAPSKLLKTDRIGEAGLASQRGGVKTKPVDPNLRENTSGACTSNSDITGLQPLENCGAIAQAAGDELPGGCVPRTRGAMAQAGGMSSPTNSESSSNSETDLEAAEELPVSRPSSGSIT